MEKKFRAGDTVKHLPSGETWTLGGQIFDYVTWLGYPPGRAKAEDCVLVQAASDEEHIKTLRQILLDRNGKLEHHSHMLSEYAEYEAEALFSPEERDLLSDMTAQYQEAANRAEQLRQGVVSAHLLTLRRALNWQAQPEPEVIDAAPVEE